MFSYIKGSLEGKTTTNIIVDINGVGFKIFMSESAISRLGELGDVVKIHTHMQVREDDISLYGFMTLEELRMFELLLSVSGIGAKSAIAMLSAITPSSFALAVISNDISKLVKIPGVGSKTAQRIVLELKDKLKAEEAIATESKEMVEAIREDDKVGEAISALKVLGYTKNEIDQAFEKLEVDNIPVEEIIKKALAYLGR